MERKVAIVGAGISGLLACKYTLSKGYTAVVFEAKSSIGGVWTKALETTRLQTPKILFQYSDCPWPDSVKDDFPTQEQVLDYILGHASRFDLLRYVRFNCKVVSLEYEGPPEEEMRSWSLWGGTGEPFSSKGKWNVAVKHTESHSTEEYQFDFVILCVGRFSDVPNIPEFPPGEGPEEFKAKVIHSMEYSDMDNARAAEFVKSKRTTVVGLGKAALDIAMECSTANGVENPCTVVFRVAHWGVSNYHPLSVPLALLYFNRFAELLVHKPGEGFLMGLLATLLAPLRWGISKFVEMHITRKHKLAKYGMVPNHSFLKDISSCMTATVPKGFYDRVDDGRIRLVKAKKFSFCNEGVQVEGKKEPVETDLVILCTGFRGIDKLKDIFVSPFFQKCIAGSDDTAVPLYRECIHPRIPQLAVIGFSESFVNLHTSEMMSRWLAELLAGTFKLPSIDDMEKDIAEWDDYFKRYSQEHYRRSCIAALHIWYNDQLCRDMGWNPKRKKNFLSELFETYRPCDYSTP